MFNTIKTIRAAIKAGSAQADFAHGRYEQALFNIDRAIEMDPQTTNNAAYLAIRGKCLFQLGRKTEAKAQLERAEELTLPLLEIDKDGVVVEQLSKIRWYLERCG